VKLLLAQLWFTQRRKENTEDAKKSEIRLSLNSSRASVLPWRCAFV
jgi:hypothetical protein